jgi:hypothetical protein
MDLNHARLPFRHTRVAREWILASQVTAGNSVTAAVGECEGSRRRPNRRALLVRSGDRLISFLRLGTLGRLGNQMFQYAVLKAVQHRRGYEVRIPRPDGLALTRLFNIPERALADDDAGRLVNTYEQPQFSYTSAVFDVPDNTNFYGYFQSERYFEHCIPEIRESLTFKSSVIAEADSLSSSLFGRSWLKATPVSLHVRRGDYLNRPEWHPVCDRSYYDEALDSLQDRFGRLRVAVFSDDLDWCRETFRGRRYRFSESNDAGIDMCLMSRCEHHVIANSSFSWWAAWLNPSPDKVVITPNRWFGPNGPEDTQDLIPSSWQRI